MYSPSIRANVVTRRTYNRELDDGSYESWGQTTARTKGHQRWLWERALGRPLNAREEAELDDLEALVLNRQGALSGRTTWLGGTEISKRREASQFNCAFLRAETTHDVVDSSWLLLNGCGVGFQPVPGTLNGFTRTLKDIEIIRSTRTEKGGDEHNKETYDPASRTWALSVGDSAEAWAKSIGKLLAGKYPAEKLILDFSEIRPAGERLKGYGWISSGDSQISRAYAAISRLLSSRAGRLLSHLDILDVENHLGTILSSRRSSQIAVYPYGAPGWEDFARAKYEPDPLNPVNPHRAQSNNSLLFFEKPGRAAINDLLDLIDASGGSEPGLLNAQEALRRAPWFSGVNPCGEILLPNKGFCNLVETDLGKFDDFGALLRAVYLLARANYRQTCVNLDDGILQRTWHENQEYLRLLGVGLTGIVRRNDLTPRDFMTIRDAAVQGGYSMADELGLPRPKNVTTIKPSGTMSKVMDTTEGAHRPPGKYIFNQVLFSRFDTQVQRLREAGYKVMAHPHDPDGVLVTLPQEWKGVKFDTVNGIEVNREPATAQLNRYRMLMRNYVDHNCSVTINYDRDEIPQIANWLDRHWDDYVGVTFMPRDDATKSAEELGYAYLPQKVVSEAEFRGYVKGLKALNFSEYDISSTNMADEPDCATGACPVR